MAKNGKALSGVVSGAGTGFMAGGPIGAAVGGVLGGLGGMFGDSADSANEERIAKAQAANLALYNQLVVPDQTVDYQNLSNGPMLDPRLQNVDQLSANDNMQDINLDPRLAQAKMNSLDVLSKIAGSGFTASELNALQEQRSAQESDLTSKLKALQQNQQARGVGNSDMALSQQMMEAQSNANRGAASSRALQAEGLQRSLNAITQGGNLANQFENTDYSRQQNLANALNTRENTNFRERANVNASNVNRFNEALVNNTARIRSVADSNVGIGNKQQDERNRLGQNKFGNEISKIQGQSGANSADASSAQQGIADSNATWGGLLSGAAQVGAAYAQGNKKKES